MPKYNRITKDDAQKLLVVNWKDGSSAEIEWKKLRDNCPCADCAELHGPADPLRLKLAPNYTLESVSYVGNYAVQLNWGDGHNAGLYSWNYLRELAGLLPAPQ
ncbi:MAG: DUF971 domain-containing protein [Anaerolineae bacterium]